MHFFWEKAWRTDPFFTKYCFLPEEFYLSCVVAMGLSFTGCLEQSGPERSRAAYGAWLQVSLETWDCSHPVFVLMLIWEYLPSSSRLCLLLSSFFLSWFSHFLKLPYACLKKLQRSVKVCQWNSLKMVSVLHCGFWPRLCFQIWIWVSRCHARRQHS